MEDRQPHDRSPIFNPQSSIFNSPSVGQTALPPPIGECPSIGKRLDGPGRQGD
jgi:hypothetical protein